MADFGRSGNHRDAPTQVLETKYQAGLASRAAQRWEEAVTAFAQAGNFRDGAHTGVGDATIRPGSPFRS